MNALESKKVLPEYKINDSIKLRLEDGKTIIYVNGKRFLSCKLVLLNITKDAIDKFDNLGSIDEVINRSMPEEEMIKKASEAIITPEEEFWGHCSNLQAWFENDYDMCLIDSRLGFPLLMRLKKAGDNKASRAFKEEYIKRIKSGWIPAIVNLWREYYLKEFTQDERQILINEVKRAIKFVLKINGSEREVPQINFLLSNGFLFLFKNEIQDLYSLVKDLVKNVLKIRGSNKEDPIIKTILEYGYLNFLNDEEKLQFPIIHSFRDECLNILETQREFRTCEELVLKKQLNFDSDHHSSSEKKEFLDGIEIFKKNFNTFIREKKNPFNKTVKLLILNGYFSTLTKKDIKNHQKLQKLEALKYINLSYSHIAFPKNFGYLSALKHFSLNGPSIIEFPESFVNLQSLESLNLKINNMNKLPELIYKLKNLKTLILNRNKLKMLPESIGRLTNLKELHLNSNKLEFLPNTIENLTSLESLDLSSNKLKMLPESIGRLTNLKTLYLNNNKLESLPLLFKNLKTLLHLDLRGNNLKMNRSYRNRDYLKMEEESNDLFLSWYDGMRSLTDKENNMAKKKELNQKFERYKTLLSTRNNIKLDDNPIINDLINDGILPTD